MSNSFCVELRPFRKCRAILESVHGNSCGEKTTASTIGETPSCNFVCPQIIKRVSLGNSRAKWRFIAGEIMYT